jgi:pSer/pThr/pTyr-binding forkhead associated (FHA) protein
MAKVIVSIDGVVIKEAELSKARSTLGRRPYNDIVIDNLAVSGEHVAFLLADGRVTVEDLNSTNGAYVNGAAVKRQLLQNGDTIEIGKYKIVFVDEPAEVNVAPVASQLGGLGLAAAGLTQGVGIAIIHILSGSATGRDLPLTKVVTTVGKPGIAVASITRRQTGYVMAQLEGPGVLLLNGQKVGDGPSPLSHGDLIELADTRMKFALS